MKTSTGIIMAAGFSRRFLANKLLACLHGKPLFTYILQAAISSTLDQIVVVSQYDEILQYARSHGLLAVHNPRAALGQSQSVVLGVSASQAQSHLMFLPADQPFITPTLIDTLLGEARRHPSSIILPTVQEVPNSPAIFPPALRRELLELTGDNGGRPVIQKHPSLVHKVAVLQPHSLDDINTPEDIPPFTG